MADVNYLITLGIGTPSGIPHLLWVGLGAGDTVTGSPRQVFLLGSRDTAPQLVGRSHATVVVVGRA